MGVPKVVIVGRPNVGKSSIFNWLIGERLAIVDATAGVTRDRMIHPLELEDRYIELIDTGGMGIEDVDDLTAHVEEQIAIAIDSADLILFVVDARSGPLPLDMEVIERLRHVKATTICVANKADTPEMEPNADEFYRFGLPVTVVSAQQKIGRSRLIAEIENGLPPVVEGGEQPDEDAEMRVAIVGRRNTGKSTFINTLGESDRMIVSEVPGTTRDSVDVRFELDGKSFIAVDTPGFRRRQSISSNVDYYGTHRAQRAIRLADVVLLFFDAGQRIGKVDKQLADYIAGQYKPCIFVVNKWDLMAESMATERWADYLRETFGSMWHVPIAFITGKESRNVKRLLNHAQMLFKQSRSRISTGRLNKLVGAALEHNPPPLYKHRRPKVFYATQVAVQPPTVVLFCNDPKAFSTPYKRYLLGVFRDELSFGEVPIKLYLRKRESHDTTDEIDAKLAKE